MVSEEGGGWSEARREGRGRLQKFRRHPAAAAAAVTPFSSAKRRIRMLGRLCQGPNAVGQKFSFPHAQF